MQEIFDRFLETAVIKCRLRPGKILVALSGGPDSVALLHLLFEAREKLQIRIVVGHVHHHLRSEAAGDLQFCQKLAQNYGLSFFVRHIQTKQLAKQEKISIETAARRYRHRALAEMAEEAQCLDIALGHTADDQAETVFSQLVRGSGVRGVAGIPFRYGRRVRPILTLYRRDILAYIREKGLLFREDETNLDTAFRRNLIRHEILPQIQQKLNPKLLQGFNRVAAIHQETEEYLNHQASQALDELTKEQTQHKIVLDIQRFWRYFTIIRKYILRNALEKKTERLVRPDFASLTRAENLAATGEIGKSIPLQGRWELLIDHDGLVLWDGYTRKFNYVAQPGQAVEIQQKFVFKISESSVQVANIKKIADKNNQFIDADQIKGTLHIRTVQPEDCFRPLGLGGTKKVIDLLADHKVPHHKRGEVPIVACEKGIIWVVGYQIDERFKVSKETQHFLHLQIREIHT